jgi:hypothetical protein
MTKSENRELLNVLKYMDYDMGLAARTLSRPVRGHRRAVQTRRTNLLRPSH